VRIGMVQCTIPRQRVQRTQNRHIDVSALHHMRPRSQRRVCLALRADVDLTWAVVYGGTRVMVWRVCGAISERVELAAQGVVCHAVYSLLQVS
jgi:hypothetical protein